MGGSVRAVPVQPAVEGRHVPARVSLSKTSTTRWIVHGLRLLAGIYSSLSYHPDFCKDCCNFDAYVVKLSEVLHKIDENDTAAADFS